MNYSVRDTKMLHTEKKGDVDDITVNLISLRVSSGYNKMVD